MHFQICHLFCTVVLASHKNKLKKLFLWVFPSLTSTRNANWHLLMLHASTSKLARIKKARVTTHVSFLHLAHKLSQIQLKKSSAGWVHHQSTNSLVDMRKRVAFGAALFFVDKHAFTGKTENGSYLLLIWFRLCILQEKSQNIC